MEVEFGKWQKIERKELTPPIPFGVEKIEILNLDEGSKNDGTETFGNYGMIYGKSYKLRVSKFAHNIAPKNKNDIKWQVSYLGKGNVLTLTYIQKTGDEIVFNCDNLDYCGQTISFYAFVRESGKEQNNKAKLEVFCHNRFRWFDKKVFEKELLERTDHKKSFLIDQNGTSLCGMACIFYLFAKYQSQQYKSFSQELFRTGKATNYKFTVKPGKEIIEKNPKKSNFPERLEEVGNFKKIIKMPLIDFITLAGTRNTKNKSYKGGNEEFQAINWPGLMVGLCKHLLGYENVSSKGIYIPIKKSFSKINIIRYKETIDDINKQISNGYKLILMIDSDLIKYDEDNLGNLFEFEYHWVVLENFIEYIDKNGIRPYYNPLLNFKVFSWGTNTEYLKKPISLEHFITNYYGYIKVK